jgi:hypothetical protein
MNHIARSGTRGRVALKSVQAARLLRRRILIFGNWTPPMAMKPIPYAALAEFAAELAELCDQYEDLAAEIREIETMDSDLLSERLKKTIEEKCPNYPSIKMTEILNRIQRPN